MGIVPCLCHIKFVEIPRLSRDLYPVVYVDFACAFAHGKKNEIAAFFLKDE